MKDDKQADMKDTRTGRKNVGMDKRLHACMNDSSLNLFFQNSKYTDNAHLSKVHPVMRTLL